MVDLVEVRQKNTPEGEGRGVLVVPLRDLKGGFDTF